MFWTFMALLSLTGSATVGDRDKDMGRLLSLSSDD